MTLTWRVLTSSASKINTSILKHFPTKTLVYGSCSCLALRWPKCRLGSNLQVNFTVADTRSKPRAKSFLYAYDTLIFWIFETLLYFWHTSRFSWEPVSFLVHFYWFQTGSEPTGTYQLPTICSMLLLRLMLTYEPFLCRHRGIYETRK